MLSEKSRPRDALQRFTQHLQHVFVAVCITLPAQGRVQHACSVVPLASTPQQFAPDDALQSWNRIVQPDSIDQGLPSGLRLSTSGCCLQRHSSRQVPSVKTPTQGTSEERPEHCACSPPSRQVALETEACLDGRL
jgi:hypothetical protein